MKKGGEYVTRGTPMPRRDQAGEASEPLPTPAPAPLSAALSPADLPRDWGMAGEVGAYEVPPLADSVEPSLNALTERFRADPLAEVNAALDRLLPPADRHRLAAEAFADGLLTLSLARRADRLLAGRLWVPRLQAELTPALGRLAIRLIDR